MRQLNLDQLRTLVTVADLGSFAAAARTLSLAVSVGRTTIRAGLKPQVTIARLALSQGDAYEIWPAATCTDALRTCLAGAGDDT